MSDNKKVVIGLYREGKLMQTIQCPYLEFTNPIDLVKCGWARCLNTDGQIIDDDLQIETARSAIRNVLNHVDDTEGLLYAEPMQKAVFILQHYFRLSKIYYDSDSRELGFE